MNQMCMSFTETRYRKTDSDTSKAAAKAAVTRKAAQQRLSIYVAVKTSENGLTAREISQKTNMDYIACQRRIAETGLKKTAAVRDGCRVWVAA